MGEKNAQKKGVGSIYSKQLSYHENLVGPAGSAGGVPV
jgi:hypothetical protein